VRLRHLDEQNEARRRLAALYDKLLPPDLVRPVERAGCCRVYHLYVMRVPAPAGARDELRRDLEAAGIGTGIHYPVPIHRQPAYADGEVRADGLSVTEQAADEIVSLPMYPTLSEVQVERVAAAVAESVRG